MAEIQPGFSAEQRADNDNRKSRSGPPIVSAVPPEAEKPSWKKRWNAVQFSKANIVWLCLAMIISTMILGFTWGGWVTARTAERAATAVANDAVVERLSMICVAQFQQDPAKAQKLTEFNDATSYQQRNFVRDQGWATMPGDDQANNQVASECAKALAQLEAE